MKALYTYIKILHFFRLKLSYFLVICLLGLASNGYAQNKEKDNNQKTQKDLKSKDQIKKDKIKNLANELYLDDSEIGTSNYENLSNSEIISIKLPPLSVLFENMEKNPVYKQAFIQYQQDLIKVGQQKRSPLEWITASGNYNYGMNSGLTTHDASSSVSVITTSSNQLRTFYNVGISFSTSFADLFNYSSNVKIAKLKASNSKALMEEAELEIKQKIIQIYLTIKAQEEELKVDNEMVNMFASTFKIAEGQFANGEKEATSLAEIKKGHALAVGTLQKAKLEFISNLMFLELITHTKIR